MMTQEDTSYMVSLKHSNTQRSPPHGQTKQNTGRCPAAKTQSLQYVHWLVCMCETKKEKEWACPEVLLPAACLFLKFLTIKPQGWKGCLYPFIDMEGEIESEKKMDKTVLIWRRQLIQSEHFNSTWKPSKCLSISCNVLNHIVPWSEVQLPLSGPWWSAHTFKSHCVTEHGLQVSH